MTMIKLEKRYPHIADEDFAEIFNAGYLQGWENARRNAISIRWIQHYTKEHSMYGAIDDVFVILHTMMCEWESENEAD